MESVHSKPTFGSTFIGESKQTLKLAFPMIIGQLGQLTLPIISTMMMARVGVVPLAGVSFGAAITTFFLIIAMGLCAAVHVFVSQSHGDNKKHDAADVLKHGIWIVTIYATGLSLVFSFDINLLNYFGQSDDVLQHAKPFVMFAAWSIVPELIFRCFRNYSEAWGYPWPAFFATVFYVLIDILFSWVFIFFIIQYGF
jgi:MATE family multidrug resistance protein